MKDRKAIRRHIIGKLHGTRPRLTYESEIPSTQFRIKVDRTHEQWTELVVDSLLWIVRAYNDAARSICDTDPGPAAKLYIAGVCDPTPPGRPERAEDRQIEAVAITVLLTPSTAGEPAPVKPDASDGELAVLRSFAANPLIRIVSKTRLDGTPNR